MKFIELCGFRKNNPTKWPSQSSNDINEKNLGLWCNHQRMRYLGKLKKYKEFPKERCAKLNSIHFNWLNE